MTAETDALWADYFASGSRATRDKLIVAYAPLAKFVAARLGAGLPRMVEHADLVSYGMFGLIDAIERYDRSRGAKFETFAMPRVKGAILDELRSMDWVPRSVRSKARSIERAVATFENDFGRAPTDEELSDRLGVKQSELHKTLTDISFGGIGALDEVRSGGEGETVTLRDLLAETGMGPGDTVDAQETRRMLGEFLRSMPDRDRQVLTLYYFESLTMSEIGEIFGVSESRVCQIHAKAVLELRSKFSSAVNG